MVKYRIIGDDSATTFFDIDQNFGNVTLKSSVNFDTTSNYKVIIFGSNSLTWLSANLKSLIIREELIFQMVMFSFRFVCKLMMEGSLHCQLQPLLMSLSREISTPPSSVSLIMRSQLTRMLLLGCHSSMSMPQMLISGYVVSLELSFDVNTKWPWQKNDSFFCVSNCKHFLNES